MRIEFDPDKDAINQKKHGVSLSAAENFDWGGALYYLDQRNRYGEWRVIAVGFVSSRLHYMVFTDRCGVPRIISLRKANSKEVREYERRKH